jgi:putative flippase GtrA
MKAQTFGMTEKHVPGRLTALARFLLVGFTGIGVNELVYVALVANLGVWFVAAAILSTEVSTTWNFIGNEKWAFSGRRFVGPVWVRYLSYAAVNNILLLLRIPTLWLLAESFHMRPATSNLVALGVLFAVRFAVSDGFVWRKKGANPYSEESDALAGQAAFRYNIAGLIRLDSDSELPELAYFRTVETTAPDIRIKIRRVGALPGPRIRLQRSGDRVTYREQLGVLGADFNLTMGNPIEIEASPLLALSRHVLYTNVVEALLRFILVSKGYVLLHSAGMEVNGRATMLSAQTDTGKTSTVINLVRERGWGFISDDMAIIDPAGRVRTFPKPMTLSYHTMVRAVDANTLSPKQRMQLQVQSRIHSKSGRSVGKGLGSLNIPIMSINSVVQLVVPPPKYHITSLMPAHITEEAPIDNVFLMERGEPIEERVSLDDAVNQLIENTDDAYGFPPFATLAPNLVINGADYMALRARERRILATALQNVKIWRLRVRGHEWGELLPRLILDEQAEARPGRGPVAIPVRADREPVGIPIEADQRVGIPIQVDANAPATATAAAEEFLAAGLAQSAAGVSAEMLSGVQMTHDDEAGQAARAGGAGSELPFAVSRPGAKGLGAAMAFAAGRQPEIYGPSTTSGGSGNSAGSGNVRDHTAGGDDDDLIGGSGGTGGLALGGRAGGPPPRPPGGALPSAIGPGAASAAARGLAARAAAARAAGGVSDAVAIPAGGYGLIGVPTFPNLTEARSRAAANVRANVRWWAALAAVIAVGAVVRLWSIGAVGFNNDEAVYAGQGASLAGNQTYAPLFAIFRAHPLLVQFINSIPFRIFGVNDLTPRLVSVAFGLGGVAATYATGSLLFGRRAGLVAGAILALMPYDVIVTRQALLDGPETTLFVLSIYQLARFIRTGQARWLFGAAFSSGLTVLAKETAVLIVPVTIVFLLLVPEIRIRFRHQVVAIFLFVIAVAPYPAAIFIGKGTGAAGSFAAWEILRQPNHTWTFYADVLPAAVGPLAFLIGLAGLAFVIRRGRWEDRLLTCWIAIPAAFFELWPVKGFQYLMPIAPAIAILVGLVFDRLLVAAADSEKVDAWDGAAVYMSKEQIKDRRRIKLPNQLARGLSAASGRVRLPRRFALGATSVLLAATIMSVAIPTAQAVASTSISGSLAGTGGLPGGRQVGAWIKENVPAGATFLTEGPTLANIIEFYGQRQAYGLSVSPNPIRRNPAYDPLPNPDRALQLNQVQYIATDIWSAQRSPFFDTLLRRYVLRYHGALVYKQYADATDSSGRTSNQVVIEIFEVRP